MVILFLSVQYYYSYDALSLYFVEIFFKSMQAQVIQLCVVMYEIHCACSSHVNNIQHFCTTMEQT